MLKIQEIREIIKLIDQTGIEEFKYKTEEGEIKLKKGGAVQVMEAAPAAPVSAPAPAAPSAPATQPVPAAQEEPKQQEAAPAPASQDENLLEVKSPMVGTFYQSPSPDAPPFVSVGDKVKQDSVVCIVEAMKLFNEIEAEINGEIAQILVEDGQLVEYGQPLFLVKPE
ncbi:acetyl-CoA carboxylase biotin carboxyl carrier protein [Bhargavaea beijingensis]|uniref:Biotin carboxyl carrier protein of acetyl-CoA carboxylase n=1 Tax=Bhargavaea beijingensis TaxID=426756 RepID=A0A1G7H098_9BACL|nr:acetyl-CoA carboxylase biotin carboxyl carrier protein [Bhargavaea beijingensis]MCW1927147.1 acetyl-CoA carboxylase biotin carboxyl carrier protein [Bhargavaea beijingensis]RSK30868.1 acetyl-CoA carboxylase biotin carboxyl carrier protein [Bhargavaea beijingensis]SDE93850.1 acetyl-CoA carboxylase biotin carboxyl carrier protein [Bhargavaea beijingensis]